MKQYVLLLGLLLLALGCAQQQYECPDGTMVASEDDCPAPDEPDEPTTGPEESDMTNDSGPATPEQPEETTAPISIDEEVEAMISEAEDRVNSFSYVLARPGTTERLNTYRVRGDRAVIELERLPDFKISQPFSHVYVDLADDEATGYCAAESTIWCPDGVTEHDADYDDYYMRTPYQWLTSLQTATVKGNGPQLQKRSTQEVTFTTTHGTSGTMYVLDYYNLPAKVELEDGRVFEYREISINSVSEEDVTPPSV